MKKNHKHLTRLLAALALSLCLCAPAFAAGFTDSDSISAVCREAVEQMAAQGVLSGFPDGSFRPEEILTREQGAKIVTYLVLGEKVNELVCAKAPFDDVAADRWSAPWISWCAERKILLGYGDGRFGPDEVLTGDQFAKMLLCALGLARPGNYEGLGAAWIDAVREDARAAGLYEGDPSLESGLPVARQQAALLSWNSDKAARAAGTLPQAAAPTEQPEATVPSSGGSAGGSGSGGGSSSGSASGGSASGSSGGSSASGGASGGSNSGSGSSSGGSSGSGSGDLLLPEVP